MTRKFRWIAVAAKTQHRCGRRRLLLGASIACCLASAAAAQVRRPPAEVQNPAAIADVLAGRVDTAYATWWGFDREDTTPAIQSAINSGAKKVVIPNIGADWIVQPLALASNQELILEPGVVLMAKTGAFRGVSDALLTGREVRNVTIRAYGATLRMRRADYVSEEYEASQWRHVLALYGVDNVQVLGATLADGGGDGIYIGPTWDARRIPCRNVRIADCICDGNLRQGISMVSGETIRIHNCTLRNTQGASPESGIDVEPANARDLVSDVEIRNCFAADNGGSGLIASLSRLDATSRPVSLRFVNCMVRNSAQSGMRAFLREGADPAGLVEFIGCLSEGSDYSGAMCVWNTAAPIKLRFADCKWRDASRRSGQSPIHLELTHTGLGGGGGIEFMNCLVYDDRQRFPVRFVSRDGSPGSRLVAGSLGVINPGLPVDKLDEGKLPNLLVEQRLPD